MRKILAIGLAVAMMTSTALASSLEQLQPGAQIVFQMGDFKDQNTLYATGTPNGADKTNNNYSASTYKISTTGTKDSEVTYYGKTQEKHLGAKWNGQYNSVKTPSTGGVPGTKAAAAAPGPQAPPAATTGPKLDTGFGLYDTPVTGNTNTNTQADIDRAKKSIDMLARQDIQTYDFTAANFTVTVNAPVGKSLIKNYEFDGAGNLTVNLKSDYKLPSNGRPDLIISDVTVKSKRDIKKIGDNSTTTLYKNRAFVATEATGANSAVAKIGSDVQFSVGVETNEETLSAGTEIDIAQYVADDSWISFAAGDAYSGDVKFDAGNIVVKGKVYSGDVVKLQYDPAPNAATIKVIQNNPVEANIEVHNIVAKNFKTGFVVSIPVSSIYGAKADASGGVEVLSVVAANNKKLYLLSNTGVLTPAPFVYNSATGAWEGRLPAQGGTILISDVALKGVAAGTGTGTAPVNPGTGFGVDLASAIVK